MRIELTKQMREALKANQTLELVDPLTQQVYVLIGRNAKELAKETAKALSDEALRYTLAKNSYELVSNGYNWSVIAKELDRIYQEIGGR